MPEITIFDKKYQRPCVSEVHDFLKDRNALLVHFSSAPQKMSGIGDEHYPVDLIKVKAGKASGGISCSCILPTDEMGFHSVGYIGVIIKPQDFDSLWAVHYSDGGSSIHPETLERMPCQNSLKDIDVTVLETSIDSRRTRNDSECGYNEWVIKNFEVIGVIAVQPFEINHEDYTNSIRFHPTYTSVEDIQNTFDECPLYTINNGKFYRLVDSVNIPVTAQEIYGW